jgi:hypothetical protein
MDEQKMVEEVMTKEVTLRQKREVPLMAEVGPCYCGHQM